MPRGYLKRKAKSVGQKMARGGHSHQPLFSRTPGWRRREIDRWNRKKYANKWNDLSIYLKEYHQEQERFEEYTENLFGEDFQHDAELPALLVDYPNNTSNASSEGTADESSNAIDDDTFDVDLPPIGRQSNRKSENESIAYQSFEPCESDVKGGSLSDQSYSLCDGTKTSQSFDIVGRDDSILSFEIDNSKADDVDDDDARSATTAHSTLWEFVSLAFSQTELLATHPTKYNITFPIDSIEKDADAASTISELAEPELTLKVRASKEIRLGLPTECAICLEEKPNVLRLMHKCNHPSACLDCLRTQYIGYKIGDLTNFPLKCFWPGCNRIVRDVQIRRLVKNRQEMATYYSQENNSRSLRREEQKRLFEKVKYERLQQRRVQNFKVLQQCTVCATAQSVYPARFDHYTCRQCHARRAIDVWRSLDEIRSFIAVFGDYLVNCPACEKLIVKDGGCNHMICVCGEEFSFAAAQAKLNA